MNKILMNKKFKELSKGGMVGMRELPGILKLVFRKYQADHANIIVSSISFYILLTFIPFTLFSFFIISYVIDISHPVAHMEKYIANVIPAPYNAVIVKKLLRELNLISVSKRLSGPLGLLFLLLFTSRLFAVMRPAFHLIFGMTKKGFFKGKQEELFLTLTFSFIQTLIFFSFMFSLIIQVKLAKTLGGFMTRASFSLVDLLLVTGMFWFLYYFLTPVRDKKKLFFAASFGAVLWHAGKYFFQYFVLYIGRFTTLFGTFGVFLAVLFWVYFSVFVFFVCAEFLAVSSGRVNAPRPSYAPFRSKR